MKLLKDNKKLIFIIILVFIVGGLTGVVAYSVYANKVTYDNTQSGLQSTDVQGAIDEIYTKANQNNIYKDLQCPGCVYRKSNTLKYNSNSSDAYGTTNILTPSEYTTDYKTLNSNIFLGHVIDTSGHILSSYVCGINNGIFFCLKGVDETQSSLTYKPIYQENVNRMNMAFPGCNATTSGSYARCNGDINANIQANGYVDVSSGSSSCINDNAGESYC